MVDKKIIKVDILRVLFSLLFLIYTPHTFLFAQISIPDSYHSRFLNDADNLPYRNVDGIFQDDNGFVWISFFGAGISRYDGSRFVNFTKQSSTPISNNYVTEACQDHFDRIWVASAVGLDIINKNTLKPQPIPYEILQTTRNRFCNYVMCDEKGRIWYNISDVIYRVSFDDDGSISCLDSLKCSRTGADLRLTIRDIDKDGAPYTSIEGQIVKLSGTVGSGQLHSSFRISDLYIGPNNKATDILRNGNDIWIATTKGLYRHNQIIGENDIYLKDDHITSLSSIDDGIIVAGTLNGINTFNPRINDFERIKAGSDAFGNILISDNIIRSLSQIGDQLWIGTEQEGITILEKKKLSHKY